MRPADAASRIDWDRRSRVLTVLALAVVLVVPAAAALACGPNRAVQLDRYVYPTGATVYVSGFNFEPGVSVTMKVNGAPVAIATVSGTGSLNASFTAPGVAGTYILTTEGVDQQGQPLPGTGNAVTFDVVAPPPSPGPSEGGGSRSYVTPPQVTLAGCRSTGRLLSLTSANDNRTGTPGNDLILAGSGADRIDALAGDDCVDLGLGDDRGQGGLGDDLVRGGGGADRVLGNAGRDRLVGGTGADTILGGSANDTAHGDAGNDRVAGNPGRDRIDGGSGSDILDGGSGRDTVNGNRGNDRIAGGSGNDVLKGSSGNDRITGAGGRDRVSCGRGIDTVVADSRDVVARDCERIRRRRGRRAAATKAQGSAPGPADSTVFGPASTPLLVVGWPDRSGSGS